MAESHAPDFSMPQAGQTGSPKGVYAFFLFQQAAKHQWVMASKDDNFYNIERSCLSLISFCTPESARRLLFETYESKKAEFRNLDLSEEAAIVSASVFTVGKLMDHLNVALEFTEESNGGVI